MHEMGIAESVLDIVRLHVPEAQAPLVRRVSLRVGELAGVQTDSLRFCFEAIVAGTPYGAATLAIEYIPAVRRCRACGTTFPGGPLLAVCPACGGVDAPLEGGRELSVTEVELDDEDGAEGQQMTP
jgi:hydrogenase nickel incorporation protein HypA/HybF